MNRRKKKGFLSATQTNDLLGGFPRLGTCDGHDK